MDKRCGTCGWWEHDNEWRMRQCHCPIPKSIIPLDIELDVTAADEGKECRCWKPISAPALFCPADCPELAPAWSGGLACWKNAERLRHLDTPEGRVVLKCQECFDGKGDNG